MGSFISAISNALQGQPAAKGGDNRDNKAGNDGSAKARAQSEYDAARSHYYQIMQETNDKGQRDEAHKRLMDATAAMAQYH